MNDTAAAPRSAYDFEATSITGQAVPLSDYRGTVLLIVNTASACGFTPQYAGLQALHEQYGERGLVVLGFPCNQFGSQEKGSESEIASFCDLNFGVRFPLMGKIDVNGANAHPLYRRACSAPRPSSGTSPNSSSAVTVRSSAAMRRRMRRPSCPRTSRPRWRFDALTAPVHRGFTQGRQRGPAARHG